MFDVELALPVGLILLATAGLVYAAFAAYLYLRFERSGGDKHVPAAISALVMFYVLAVGSQYAPRDAFLPMLLLFLMALALAMVLWLGSQARSKAGIRIVLAGVFTLTAFVLGVVHDYRSRWR